MADAIPPTAPTATPYLLGTAGAPPDNLGGTTVNVGSNPGDLQAAITAAINADGTHKGNTLLVPAGVTYSALTLPATTGSGWTCIRSASGSLPASGTRVSSSNATAMFKVQSVGLTLQSFAVTINGGSNGWRFIGMEVTHPNTNAQVGLLYVGGHRTIFERCYLHGVTGTMMYRHFYLFGDDFQLWDSWLSDAGATEQDAQCVFARNNSRIHIENCELEATGENLLFGDQYSDLPCLDVVVKRNHLYKPLTWRRLLASGSANPSWDGILWSVKNLFEIKWASRVLVVGNKLENCWAQGQNGTGTLYNHGIPEGDPNSPKRPNGTDIMFRSNILQNAPYGFTISTNSSLVIPARIAFLNNLGLEMGGRWLYMGRAIQDLWCEHNTMVPMQGGNSEGAIGWPPGGAIEMYPGFSGAFPRFTLKRNAFGYAQYGVWISGAPTTQSYVDEVLPDRAWIENAQWITAGAYVLSGITQYASPTSAGIDTATGRLLAGSPLILAATDGTDIGVNFTTLDAEQTGTPVPGGDTVAPTVPTNLDDGTPGSTSYTLTWTASTDNVAVAGYDIEITPAATGVAETYQTTATSLVVTGRQPSSNYSNRVRARDAAANTSAYTSPLVTTTTALPAGTADPPDIMRGFGTTRGTAATDRIVLPLTTNAAQRTYAVWIRRDGVGGGGYGRVFDKTPAREVLFNWTATTMRFSRMFSTTNGSWEFTAPTSGTQSCIIIKYDSGNVANLPTVKVDNVVQSFISSTQPVGTVNTTATNFVLGNGTGDVDWDRPWDGDIAKFAVYDFLTTDQNDVDLYEGDDPMGIGAGPVAYHVLNGTANEPDAVSTNPSTITGTQVQTYTAAATTIDTLTVTEGNPQGSVAYQITATTTGTVDRVEFWADGVLERSDTSAPYTLFASADLLGTGQHTIEARVFAAAGGNPSDTALLTITEGEPAVSDSWTVGYTWARDPNATDGYKFYVDTVLRAAIAQTSVGEDPTYTATFSGNSVTPFIQVSCIYVNGVEGPKFSITKRYAATVTTGTKKPEGFQEVSRWYTP